jgi:hypothetical protein
MAEQESGSGRPGFFETLREGWKPGGRRPDPTNSSPPAGSKDSEASTQPIATKPAEAESAASQTAAASAAGSKPPASSIDERMEGVQGWMAEIERRQGRTTYFGAAAILIAVAAAGGALFFAITTPNSASKDDFDDLEAEVKTLQEQVGRATTDQTRLKELNLTIQSLEARVAAGEQKANQTAADIAKLQTQIAQAAATPTPTPAPVPAPTTTVPGSTKKP